MAHRSHYWPLASDYSAILQNPSFAFRNLDLKSCKLKRNVNGQPWGIAGPFAVVYKAEFDDGRDDMAIRVFTSWNSERASRYEEILRYLKGLRPLNCLARFDYFDKGIRISNGKWYPLVTMEWVQGTTLYRWAQQRCLGRDVSSLHVAANHWTELIKELSEADVAHGDLQHGNVLVTENADLKLVDYDCMCVPKLVGLPNLEVGAEPYQHPDRDAETLLSPQLDRFSSIVIYVAIRALAAEPKLWDEFIAPDNYGKLLFRTSDFQDPSRSALFQHLCRSADPEVRRLTRALFEIHRGSIHDVPPLSEVLFSFERVRSLLSNKQLEAAVKLYKGRPDTVETPRDLQQQISSAEQLVGQNRAESSIRELLGKLQRIPRTISLENDRQLIACWKDETFRDWPPAEQERPRVQEAEKRRRVIAQLQQLIETTPATPSIDPDILAAAMQLKRLNGLKLLNSEQKSRVRRSQKTQQARDDCFQRLKKNVEAGDVTGMQRYYQPDLLQNYPGAREFLDTARDVERILPLIYRLEMARSNEDWRKFVSIWKESEELLSRSRITQALAREANYWRERRDAFDAVQSLLDSPECDLIQLATTWDRLEELGGFPGADSLQREVEDRMTELGSFFISYRREDSDFTADRIYRKMVTSFGRSAVFFDVDKIPIGVDFREHLENAVAKCDVLLAVIGDRWLDAKGSDGKRRLDDPRDFVRIEIEAALEREIPVIPILVGRAAFPVESSLPVSIQNLVYRQAAQIRPGRDFDKDMDDLIQGLQRIARSS